MRLCTTLGQRAWTVELRLHGSGRLLVCPVCSPGGIPVTGACPRGAALKHLAGHARQHALPLHLRTCQCFERGCRWHGRHRGCSGLVLLALSRTADGRIWRLADVCAACAHVTAHTAVVPDVVMDTPLSKTAAGSPPARPAGRPAEPPHRSPEQTRVKEMLSYLASALPAWTGPEGRLLAVQCGLRADWQGCVQVRCGVLRSMRLAHSPAAWRELEEAGWLVRPRDGHTVQAGSIARAHLATPLTLAPSRSDRAQAADWALRTLSRPAARHRTATARLTALALAAHTAPGGLQGAAEIDQLAHVCSLSRQALLATLDQLVATGVATGWRLETATGDLHWRLPPPSHSQPTVLLRSAGLERGGGDGWLWPGS